MPTAWARSKPTLQPALELGDLLGRPITRVAVVLEGNVWDDVAVPPVKTVKPLIQQKDAQGEIFNPGIHRSAAS